MKQASFHGPKSRALVCLYTGSRGCWLPVVPGSSPLPVLFNHTTPKVNTAAAASRAYAFPTPVSTAAARLLAAHHPHGRGRRPAAARAPAAGVVSAAQRAPSAWRQRRQSRAERKKNSRVPRHFPLGHSLQSPHPQPSRGGKPESRAEEGDGALHLPSPSAITPIPLPGFSSFPGN